MGPSEILPGVWLGGARFMNDEQWEEFARRKKVGLVVTAAKEQKGVCSQARRLRVDVDDSPDEDLLRYFSGVCAQLEGAFARKEVVLVHCAAGISRSATLVIAWLMFRQGLSLDEALSFVRKRRPIVRPNLGFMRQLQIWETQISQS